MQPTEIKNEVKLELLPKGAFLLTLEGGQFVKGRFSMYALDRFCNDKKIDSYFSAVTKISLSMTLSDYADLILVALQDYYRKDYSQCPFDKEKVFDDIIDAMGGVSSAMFAELIVHAVGRLSDVSTEKKAEEDEEKKSLTPGSTTGDPALKPD